MLLDLTYMNQNTKRNLLLEKKLLADEVSVQYNQIQVCTWMEQEGKISDCLVVHA